MKTRQYPRTVTARVQKETRDFLDSEATQYGLNRAETLRNVVQFYKYAHREGCPACGTRLSLDP